MSQTPKEFKSWGPPKMMPGQKPYTEAEWKAVTRLVGLAARENVTEQDEEEILRHEKNQP